jgi:hypothetical protein
MKLIQRERYSGKKHSEKVLRKGTHCERYFGKVRYVEGTYSGEGDDVRGTQESETV